MGLFICWFSKTIVGEWVGPSKRHKTPKFIPMLQNLNNLGCTPLHIYIYIMQLENLEIRL
jgi:hypothetical protein